MSADSSQARDRQIAESVEALSMLKEQICGMYAALVEQQKGQVKQAVRLEGSEDRLNALIAALPKDPLTLASIVRAADRVDSTAGCLPGVLRGAIEALGEPVARDFTTTVAKPTSDIHAAAAAATAAAGRYTRAVRFATWKATGVALLVSLAMATVLAILVFRWIPSLAEIQALRAERDQLTAAIADLEKRGGKAKLIVCGDRRRLCVQTDEPSGSLAYETVIKGETYRVIKGY